MNLFQLIVKQAKQRSLSTILTMLSIALGVGLAISILVLQRESGRVFGQQDFGYEILAGVKGSGLQLTVNTVYRIDTSPGNVKYSVYQDLIKNPLYRRDLKLAIPQCVGDSYKGMPIVGTVPQYFGHDDSGVRIENEDGKTPNRFEYRPGKSFEIADGKPFRQDRFEAVLGSDVTKATGLKLGDVFQATHGFPQPGQKPDVHDEKWTVVGVLKPTNTAADRCVYIGLTSFYTIFEHAEGEIARDATRRGEAQPAPKPAADEDEHKHYTLSPDGAIVLDKDVMDAREVSAILVKARSGFSALNLKYALNLKPDVMAVVPAEIMRSFLENFIKGPTLLLLVIAVLVIVVAAVGVLTTIYNSVSARTHEIAVLRALGATRDRILLLITLEATLVGAIGAALGLLLGHGLAAAGSVAMLRTFGEGINWLAVGVPEVLCLAGVVALSFVAGLVPALKAYRTPVATNLAG